MPCTVLRRTTPSGKASDVLTDKRGIFWQITPRTLSEALAIGGEEAKRAVVAMMDMRKIDVATIAPRGAADLARDHHSVISKPPASFASELPPTNIWKLPGSITGRPSSSW